MEFPDLGKQCGVNNCNALDFLPIECNFCHITFCKEHAEVSKHECKCIVDNVISEKRASTSFKCNAENCKSSDPMEMNCVKCHKHYCLEHRHHGCLDVSHSLTKREKQRLPKEQFKKAKAETDAMVQEKLKKAKNRALANKIKLMKIKGSAVGLKTVPTANRIYFLVAPPVGPSAQSKARSLFVDKEWSYGKAIDFLAKKLNVNNTNNNITEPQLRLFSTEGELLSDDLSEILHNLLDNGVLVDGDSLILEYITPEDISHETNIFVGDRNLSKYTFI